MKKIARFIGVLGGVAAVVWAMRDRLVSIAAPREPQPPKFRVVPPAPEPSEGLVEGDDLTEVSGIGPVFATRLRDAGISTFAQLAEADPQQISEAAQVAASRAEDWIGQAKRLSSA